jgi:hypothetical protein
MLELYRPEWACPRYGDFEHDWLDCPECLAAYETWLELGGLDYERASGLCICEACGEQYYDHPPHPVFAFLVVTCDCRLWKL